MQPNEIMTETPVRFGYDGRGFVGQRIHFPNFKSLPNYQFLALAEMRPDVAAKVAARYGIAKLYRSHGEMAADILCDARLYEDIYRQHLTL